MADIPDALVEKARWFARVQGGIVTREQARAALAAVMPGQTPADKCWRHDYEHREYVCTCRPAVDRDALAEALWQTEGAEPLCDYADLHETVRSTYQEQADALLASGVLTDVATVRAAARRKVAEEIAAAIEAERVGNAPSDYVAGLNDGAYIAREAASSEGDANG